MREPQQNHRNEAAKAFVESLDQLENLLGHPSPPPQSPSRRSSSKAPTPQSKSSQSDDDIFDLDLLEEAAADLDAFFGDTELPEEE
ncbi:hypothetical protein [Coleofasciculus sp. G2-EDA-02]|uniref:hypothetical protein n=1 Tax=Coleofasciculus sp. G2-EDA-02 TaxID=3069529 RepID=UPI0033006F6D